MTIFLSAALIFAALEALAVAKNRARFEYFAKPAVMIVLLVWLWQSAGMSGAPFWFGLGILFSLAGDVLLIQSNRFFLAGLAAFLLAHTAYIIGFNNPLPQLSFWGILLALMIGLGGVRLLRRIIASLPAQGEVRLKIPIILYGSVISIMLLSAMMKLNDLAWSAGAALLVGFGALLFYMSDVILAWNKFVSPMQHGRVYNILSYHLGQILLVGGVILQFG